MRRQRRIAGRTVRVASLSMAAALSAASVLAQTAPVTSPPPTVLDPVSIDATRTTRPLFDVPGSVSVVEGERIERRQPNHFGDLLRDLPGVEISGGPRPGGIQPNIRGLEGERVQIRIDGARQDFQNEHKGRVFIDPDMIKRIEVVRGPQSTLYGSGAIAGLVSFTTKDASDFLEPGRSYGFRVKTGYQSAPDSVLTALTGFAKVDRFDVVAQGLWRKGTDYRQGGGTFLPFSGLEVLSGLVKVGADVAPGARASLTWLGYRDDGTSTTTPNTGATTAPADRVTAQHTFSGNFSYNPDNSPWFDLRASVYHTRLDLDERLRSSGRLDISQFRTTGLDVANSTSLIVADAVKLRFTYGVDGYFQTVVGRRNGAPRPQYPDANANAFGLFGQGEIKLFDIVTITPGVRFDRYQRAPVNAGAGPALQNSHVSPRISVQVDPLPWFGLYALYADAFRAPALNELYVGGTHFPGNTFIPNPFLRPEIAHNREAGVNLRFKDLLTTGDRLRGRITYFNTNYSDFIDQIITATTTTSVNRSRANISGWEAELFWTGGGFFAGIAASRIRGETTAPRSAPLASVPADKLVISAGYSHAPWGVTFGGRARFVADQNNVPADGTLRTPGYSLYDVFASWQPEGGKLRGLRMDVAVENLTDRRYRGHLSAVVDPGVNFKFTTAFQF